MDIITGLFGAMSEDDKTECLKILIGMIHKDNILKIKALRENKPHNSMET